MRDWDDEFDNGGHIPGSSELPGKWMQDAAAYRASGVRVQEHAYGAHPRARFDLVHPDGASNGLAVFVHGGYWIKTEKAMWTHFAEGARAAGWTVCMVQYTLAPEARIAEITKQVGAAINAAAQQVAGPVRIAGHSAGGHLVSRMVCSDSPLARDVQARLARCVSISGLHDLRPLMNTKMNAQQRIDAAEARTESAALLEPLPGVPVTAWVGGGERPEFIRQSRLLGLMWEGLGAQVEVVVDGAHDHFSVLDDLRVPGTPLTRAWVG